jgi:hypothetical protein
MIKTQRENQKKKNAGVSQNQQARKKNAPSLIEQLLLGDDIPRPLPYEDFYETRKIEPEPQIVNTIPVKKENNQPFLTHEFGEFIEDARRCRQSQRRVFEGVHQIPASLAKSNQPHG